MDIGQLASRIDHTLLKAEAQIEQIDRVCDEALRHGFAAVCVNGAYIAHVAERLAGSAVRPAAVAGFPLGAGTPAAKAAEAAELVRLGAAEIDVVAHLPNMLACDADAGRDELRPTVEAVTASGDGAIVKVIVETAVLMDGVDAAEAERRIEAACRAVREAGAAFIKTSTGFHALGGATVDAVRLLAKHAGGLQVKAAGGIRIRADALAMIEAGADRLGCSSGVAIVSGGEGVGGY